MPTLLVVDNEEGPRAFLKVIFGDEFRILIAEDGSSALELARSNKIEVALLDIRMADMSGFKVLESLRYIDPSIEAVMMAAFETTDTMRQALRLRAYDYVNKPFDISTIRAAVAGALERHSLGSAVRTNDEKLLDLQSELQQVKMDEEIARARGEIYASIIHDINGPLTIISGLLQIINTRIGDVNHIEGEDLELVKDRLKRITRQVTNCIEISRRHLSFCQQNPKENVRVWVNHVLGDLGELLRVHPCTRSNQLLIHPLPDDVAVPTNGTDLIQILLNLTLNALQCAPQHHRVEIRGHLHHQPLDLGVFVDGPEDRFINRENFKNSGHLLALSVQDNGPGIPPDVMPKIFEPFYTTQPKSQGTGLGLCIVHQLLKESRSALHVHSKVRQGTIFTLFIPALEPTGRSFPTTKCLGKEEWRGLVRAAPESWFSALTETPRRQQIEMLPFDVPTREHLAQCANCLEVAYAILERRARKRWRPLYPDSGALVRGPSDTVVARLMVLSEGFTDYTHELKAEKTTIGRIEDNAFLLPAPSVSSHHCEVLLRGAEVLIRDLNSTNGTFINGQQIDEAILKTGQILRLGQIEMRLEINAPSSLKSHGEALTKALVPPSVHGVEQRRIVPGQSQTDAPSSLKSHAEALTEALLPPSVHGVGRRQIVPGQSQAVEEICRDIARDLGQYPVVFYPVTAGHALQLGFAEEDAVMMQIVGAAFKHLVVLDGRKGCDAKGSFNLEHFYAYTLQRMRKTFALDEIEVHHEQDIIQILRDHSGILLCLLHLEVVPLDVVPRLRSLIQEGHRTLVILQGAQPKLRKALDETTVIPQGIKLDELTSNAGPPELSSTTGFEKKSKRGGKIFAVLVIILGLALIAALFWVSFRRHLNGRKERKMDLLILPHELRYAYATHCLNRGSNPGRFRK